MPDVWVSRCRTVTGAHAAGSPGRISVILPSSDTLPSSTSSSVAIAVNGLVTEASW
jgi:hypothetical protein